MTSGDCATDETRSMVCIGLGRLSVQQVQYAIDFPVWNSMGHRSDGAVIPDVDN